MFNQSLVNFLHYLELEKKKGKLNVQELAAIDDILRRGRWFLRKIEQQNESDIVEAIQKAFNPTEKDISYKNYNYRNGDYDKSKKKKK